MISRLLIICFLLMPTTATAGDFIDITAPFNADSSIAPEVDGGELVQTGFVDGLFYIIRRDGSARFTKHISEQRRETWIVTCDVDPIDDDRSCRAKHRWLVVGLDAGSGWRVVLTGDTFPYSKSWIRLRGGAAIEAVESLWSGAQAQTIIKGLETEGEVRTRYTDWPYNAYVDGTLNPPDFTPVKRYLTWAVNQRR